MGPVVAVVAAAVSASAAFSGGIVLFGATLVAPGFAAAAIAGLGSLALGFVSQALTPKPPKPPGATPIATQVRENTVMVRQAITARRIVYGWTRASGPQTFVHSTSNDEKLHIVLTLSTHQVSRMDALLLDDEVVPLDSNGVATGRYVGKVRAFFGDGTTSGDATFHSKLTESVTSDKWGSSHLQKSCAKIYVELSFNKDLFPVGVPNISVIMRGKNDILDTRTSTTGWTDNAALCVADWLKSEYGYRWAAADIDTTALNAAANACDEMVDKNPTYTFTADASTDRLTISLDLASNTTFRVSNSGGALPAGLSATTTYFWRRVSATQGQVCTSEANVQSGTVVDITGAGTGTHTLARVIEFTADASTDVITVANTQASLRNGTRFQVASDSSLPGGLSAATNYFWIALTKTTGKVATTLANARAGTAVDITSAGTGPHTLQVNAEPRYTLNGIIDSEQPVDEVLGKMLSAMAGLRITQGKTIKLYAGVWRAPSVTLDEDDLSGGISVQTRQARRDVFNGVKGVYSNPDELFQPTDFPPVQVASYVTEDQSVELWRDADFPFTNSPSMAMRIARIDLERARRQITTTWPCKLVAMRIAGADTLSLTNTRLGWSAKSFEVARWTLNLQNNRGAPMLGIQLECREIDANVYAWTPSTDESAMQPARTTTLPDPFTVAAPTGLTLTSGTTVLGTRLDGTIFSRILVQWTAPTTIFVTSGGFIEGEVRKNSEASNWRPAFTVRGDVTQAYVLDVDDGVAYVVRVRSKTSLGTTSDWTTSSAHTVVGKTAPPSNVTTFSAQQNGNVVVFKWSQISDADLSGYEIRYMQAPFDWGDALVLTAVTKGTQVTSAAVPPSPINPTTNLPIPWIFGIKAVDTSGNYSTTALTRELTVTNTFDIIEEQENWPLWPGWESGKVDIYNAVSDSKVGVLGAEVASGGATDIEFKPDGSKVYVTDNGINGKFYQYSLVDWEINSLTYDSKSYTRTLHNVAAFAIKPDGTKLIGIGNQTISQYTFGTPWDISTLSLDNVSVSVTAQSPSLWPAMTISADGKTILALSQNSGQSVYQYSLLTAWDISSATYTGKSFGTESQAITGEAVSVAARDDGYKLWLFDANSRQVLQYSLMSPWDLTGVKYDNVKFQVESLGGSNAARYITFRPGGHRLFTLATVNKSIYQYRVLGGFHRNPWTGNLNPISLSDASGNDFNVFDSYVHNPVSLAVYETNEVDVGINADVRIWGDVGAQLAPVASGDVDAQLEVDYRASTGSYDGFQTWAVGDATARYVKARVRSDPANGQTILTRLNLTVDAQERTETGSVSITGGQATVTFAEFFANAPMVRTWNAEASAKIPGFDTVTTSTFIARLYDAAGSTTSGVNFWEATGV